MGVVEEEITKAMKDGVDINQRDKHNRTAMDLASLSGQLEILDIFEKNGDEFAYKPRPRMKAIAKKRSSHVELYRRKVEASLSSRY